MSVRSVELLCVDEDFRLLMISIVLGLKRNVRL